MNIIDRVVRTLKDGKGVYISEKFFNIKTLLEMNENDKTEILNHIDEVNFRDLDYWKEIIKKLIKCIDIDDREECSMNYIDAVKMYNERINDLDDSVTVPITKKIVSSLYMMSENVNTDYILKAVMHIFREYNKKFKEYDGDWVYESPLVSITLAILKIYTTKNNYHQAIKMCSDVERNIENLAVKYGNKLELSSLYFLLAKMYIYTRNHDVLDYKDKILYFLTESYKYCLKTYNNVRLILVYLIPIRILCKDLPTDEVIEKYDLFFYRDIVRSVQILDINLFRYSLENNCKYLVNFGVWDMTSRIENIIYYKLFDLTFRYFGKDIIDLHLFTRVLNTRGEYNDEEAECIISNLIYNNIIDLRCFIADRHRKVSRRKGSAN